MSTYENEHNITNEPRNSDLRGARSRQHQTLTSILDNLLAQSSNNSDRQEVNVDQFSNALRILNSEEGSSVALNLINVLENYQSLDSHHSKGVPQEFLDSLERVPIEALENKDTADCPICTNRFIDDKYPLLVKLPCNVQQSGKPKGHIFDLECIGPWLKMNSTCPLCRFDILEVDKKRREKIEAELKQLKEEDSEEEEEEWDDYA